MSAFSTNKPEPGWEKRWVREAFSLMVGNAHIILFFMMSCLLGGWLMTLMIGSDIPALLKYVLRVPFYFAFFSPVIVFTFYLIARSEGYVKGPFKFLWDSVQISLFTAVMCNVVTLPLFLITPLQAQPVSLISVTQNAASVALAFVFGSFGMFRQLATVMVQGSDDENRFISLSAYEQLKTVYPKITRDLIIMLMFTYVLFFLVALPIYMFFLFWVYVAGREIIGGISGNREKEKQTEHRTVQA